MTNMPDTHFRPTATIETLRNRAVLIRAIHDFFDSRGFFHVETPVLSRDTVIDRYLDPISVRKSDVTNEGTHDELLWLQTSPEFGMKRLLAAGADSIYQITRAFRAAEAGARHNPEFTMLEWYRVGDSMQAAIDFLAEFAESILKRTQTIKITYRDAFQQFANLDPFTASLHEFQTIVKQNKINLDSISAKRFDRDGWLNLILGCIVEPCLGVGQPTIVYDWPASQAALAVVREEEFPVAERFELYVDGFELANGYHELLDPQELEQRNQLTNRQRIADGKRALPENSRLLDAMRNGLPVCAGVALGVDRLIMIALGANSIEEVIAFPIGIA